MSLPPLNVPELLRRFGLRPDKSLGQNFLVDPEALEAVMASAGVEPGDAVLEIGPGLGSLTRLLAQSARQVVAVEIDADLLPPLKTVLAPFDNVQVIHGDIMTVEPSRLMQPVVAAGSSYRVVANIPYYITSALIRKLLEADPKPGCIVLTVQREVAERITAAPGDLSLLALSVQVYGKPYIAARIPATAFYPPPKVDSAVVRVDLYPGPRIPEQRLERFFRLAKAGFSQKRKTLRNSLSAGLRISPQAAAGLLEQAGIDPQRRAETLSIEEWEKLVEGDLPGQNPP